MSILSTLVTLFVFGFPLLLIFIQWILIRRRLPWVGMAVSLVILLLLMLVGFVVSHSYEICDPILFCGWDGIGLLFIEGYAMVVAVITTAIGLVIQAFYRRLVWKPGEIIAQTGKMPSFLLMGAIIVLLAYFVLIMIRMR
jgi:hypothetical protein